VSGEANYKNSELEKAGRVADFMELGELMAQDALHREESCGGHFREEYQTEDNEAKRNDDKFCFVSAWEMSDATGTKPKWSHHQEDLEFENVKLSTRSYK
jgi:succinate dehydrogenase / fumarate reductase flavoprotein subunit